MPTVVADDVGVRFGNERGLPLEIDLLSVAARASAPGSACPAARAPQANNAEGAPKLRGGGSEPRHFFWLGFSGACEVVELMGPGPGLLGKTQPLLFWCSNWLLSAAVPDT